MAAPSKANRTKDEPLDCSISQSAESDAAWKELLGPLLDSNQVQELLGVSSQDVQGMTNENVLLALPTDSNNVLFPRFQFAPDGRVYPDLPRILAIFDGVVITKYTVASWLKGPKAYLGGMTPIRWFELGRDPAPVLAGAEVAAARFAR